MLVRERVCTCGDRSPHIVAERKTADGVPFVMLNDGALLLKAHPVVAAELGLRRDEFAEPDPRLAPAQFLVLVADGFSDDQARELLGWIEACDGREVRALIASARKGGA